IEYVPPFDPRVTERLRALLDDPKTHRWIAAASTLARRKDPKILRRLLAWFLHGDRDHRNVAFALFPWLLDDDDRLTLFQRAWKAGGRDDDDRALLASGLLGLGDRAGWDFLVSLARRADCYSATWAAETIYKHAPALGLELMATILNRATTDEVRWGMVEKIARKAGLPHVWAAEGLAEARHWVQQELRALEAEGTA